MSHTFEKNAFLSVLGKYSELYPLIWSNWHKIRGREEGRVIRGKGKIRGKRDRGRGTGEVGQGKGRAEEGRGKGEGYGRRGMALGETEIGRGGR